MEALSFLLHDDRMDLSEPSDFEWQDLRFISGSEYLRQIKIRAAREKKEQFKILTWDRTEIRGGLFLSVWIEERDTSFKVYVFLQNPSCHSINLALWEGLNPF